MRRLYYSKEDICMFSGKAIGVNRRNVMGKLEFQSINSRKMHIAMCLCSKERKNRLTERAYGDEMKVESQLL
jgi:hypothetical protein